MADQSFTRFENAQLAKLEEILIELRKLNEVQKAKK